MKDRHLTQEELTALVQLDRVRPLYPYLAHLAEVCEGCSGEALRQALEPVAGEPAGCVQLEQIDDLLENEEAEERRDAFRLILHLACRCGGCRAAVTDLLDLWNQGLLPEDFDIYTWDLSLARSRARGRLDWQRLKDLPTDQAFAWVKVDGTLNAWGLGEILCEEGRRLAAEDPEQALIVARMAVIVAARANDLYPEPVAKRHELQMLAAATEGNALRVLEELRYARQAFGRAEGFYQRFKEGYTNFRARMLSLRASLEVDDRRFEAALEDLDLAVRKNSLFAPTDRELEARCYLQMAMTYGILDRLSEAFDGLGGAAQALEHSDDSRLLLMTHTHRVDLLSRLGRIADAAELMPEVERLARKLGTPSDHVRITWLRARLAAGQGEAKKGEKLFRQAQRGFLDAGQGYGAAVVTLELATHLFQEGKVQHVRRLALEMVPIFQAHDIHREALAALALFHHTAVTEALTEGFLGELVAYLHKAQGQPRLKFQK